jgi:hypothetical protein
MAVATLRSIFMLYHFGAIFPEQQVCFRGISLAVKRDVLEIQRNLQRLEDFVNLGDLAMLITKLAFAYLMSAIPLEDVPSIPSTASLNQMQIFIELL